MRPCAGFWRIELNVVQQRVFSSAHVLPFVISVSQDAKDFLLAEGTDLKYGARHLKRAIDRLLVHPLSNLMASSQVRGGDLVRVDFDSDAHKLIFFKDAEDLSTHAMLQMVDDCIVPPPMIASASRDRRFAARRQRKVDQAVTVSC